MRLKEHEKEVKSVEANKIIACFLFEQGQTFFNAVFINPDLYQLRQLKRKLPQ